MNPLSIGIEIGGTKIQVGVSSTSGTLLKIVRQRVIASMGAEGIRSALVAMVAEALRAVDYSLADINQIGIGFGGPVNTDLGVCIKSFQIAGWENYPLRDWAEKQWNKPVFVENDASAAGLAECIHGSGRGYSAETSSRAETSIRAETCFRRVFYITLGSGVGGGWILNGRIDRGQGLGSAEIGHVWAPEPRSGILTELEQICSGWAIGRRARAAALQEKTIMTELAGSIDDIDAQVVYSAAEQGDELANLILLETCQTLGLAIGNVITLLHPERVIIGGGVSQMGALFWNTLRDQISLRTLPLFRSRVEIAPAELGEDVVVIGALCLG